MTTIRHGRVTAFDEAAGLGTVTSEHAAGGDRSEEYRFHCTGIAGGSRVIAVGTEVRFSISPGHLGQWEAAGLEPYLSGGGPPAGDEDSPADGS